MNLALQTSGVLFQKENPVGFPLPSISAFFACFRDSATSVIFFALKVGPSQRVPITRTFPETLSRASALPNLKAP